jgi:hypothetical protein
MGAKILVECQLRDSVRDGRAKNGLFSAIAGVRRRTLRF